MLLERAAGIEPATKPWQGLVLPLAPCPPSLVPHLRVELRKLFLLREATLPICPVGQNWLRGKESNLRPLGYEPSSLPLTYPAVFFNV